MGYDHISTSGRHSSHRDSLDPLRAACFLQPRQACSADRDSEAGIVQGKVRYKGKRALSGKQRSCLAESIHAGTPGKPDSARDGVRKIGPEYIEQLCPMSWISQKSSHALLLDEVGRYGTDLSQISADARPAFVAEA